MTVQMDNTSTQLATLAKIVLEFVIVAQALHARAAYQTSVYMEAVAFAPLYSPINTAKNNALTPSHLQLI